VTNAATLVILALLARRMLWPALPRGESGVAWPLQRTMLAESWPLMAALLLQVLFPSVNVLLLSLFRGDAAVGWYDAGRKWLDALSPIPALFTFAAFPVMARQAVQDLTALRRSVRLAVKALTILSLPAAVLVTLAATSLVGLLSGSAFLPYGAIALRLLIWSIVFGWINSLTNYVLIALNRQRYVLLVSGGRVLFTVLANLLLTPRFGYVASAWILTAGELLLLALFSVDLRRRLGPLGWLGTLGRPALAGLAMGAASWGAAQVSLPLAFLVGPAVYVAAFFLLRVLSAEDWEALGPLLPAVLRRRG